MDLQKCLYPIHRTEAPLLGRLWALNNYREWVRFDYHRTAVFLT
jgi:hypothetical protein